MTEQFQYVDEDIKAGRYENAKQRLEFIIANDPSFPGAQEKLTQVLVLMNAPTITVTPSLTPTPDFSGAQEAYSKAQQLIASQDWPDALGALDTLRKLDSTYQQSQVDGMYYFAFRNYGFNLITKDGNLEGGIYQLTLAERFGPLDRDTNALREGSRFYIIGASFWELDWKQALFYFDQVYRGYPGLWDGTMTAAARFQYASMRYGDELFRLDQNCDALQQYQNAQAISPLDKVAQHNYDEAFIGCYPATPTLELPTETPTVGAPTTYP
jgi:tetratricopeptide (TPR) repeat protein